MHRWKISILAAAAIATTGLFAADAHALALGQIHVRSALGEPLRAEIDLPQISDAEAESLKATTGAPGVYRAQGLEYSSAINDIRVQFQRRPDGTGVLRLSSSRAVNDPFVDLVIDATWASGHIVRSYTLLLDPPETRRNAPPQPLAPQIPAPTAAPAPARTAEPVPAPRNLPEVQERRPQAVAPAPQPRTTVTPPAVAATAAEDVRVRAGDTAGRLANAHRPAGVSLDQMLVAMLRANPDAFIDGNVNRLRAGSVLQMPTDSQASAVAPKEARRIIAAQSRDFNEFRRRLAASAPSATVAAPQRAATGSVQAQVDDQKPATASSDKLTLSKGGVQATKADEKLAQDRQSSQNAERMAELNKNISELNKLSTAAGAPAGAASTAASTPAELPSVATVPATVPGAAADAASAAANAASSAAAAASDTNAAAVAATDAASAASAANAAASEAAAAASQPAPKKPAQVVPPPPPPPEPTFLESLLEDPLKLGGIGAILALLLGYGVYRSSQRRKAQSLSADSSMLDSQLQPDSFFGASGGQRIDTANSGLSTGSSSLAYSPSQLDAGEVDPVAEADVYLAYGRDLQAEEILREAARITPERASIHVKLAEIYAKRQDRKALEAQAKELWTLTQGQGADWARVADMGRGLDPDNVLYQATPRAAGVSTAMAAGGVAAAGAAAAAIASGMREQQPELDAPSTLPVEFTTSAPAPMSPDLAAGLDLDLDLGTQPQDKAPAASDAAAPAASTGLSDFELPSLSLDQPTAPGTFTAPPAEAVLSSDDGNALDFSMDDLSFDLPSSDKPAAAPSPAEFVQSTSRQPLEFDLDGVSLDLDTPSSAPAASYSGMDSPTTAPAPLSGFGAAPIPEEPLATKLALAEEFNAIGDSEGARTLVEEVIAEASGELKQRAQQMLAKLG